MLGVSLRRTGAAGPGPVTAPETKAGGTMQLSNLAAWWNARKQDRAGRHPFDSAAAEELYALLDEASMVSHKR